MLAVGLVVLLAGYSAVYVGVERLRGDKRHVTDIWKGVGAIGPTSGGSSGGGGSAPQVVPQAPGPFGEKVPLNPGAGGGTGSGGSGGTPF